MGLFGFLKKGKEEQADPQVHEVGLQDLVEWFEAARSAELKQKREEAERMHNSLADRFSEIKKRLDAMDRARITGVERLHISANMIKETFVRKKYPPLKKLPAFREGFRHDYRYFLGFQEKTMEVLEELKGSSPKQTILLSRYFKKESQALVEAMKQAEQASLQFREYLKTGSGALRTLARIRSTVESISQLIAESRKMESDAGKLEEVISESKKKKADLEKAFLKLLKSREWNSISKLTKEVEEAREALRQADVRLSTELSSLRKPLKKIEHVMVNRGKLSPIHKNSLRDFMRNPFKAVIAGKEGDMVRTMDAVKKQLDKLGVSTEYEVDSLKERFGKDVPEFRKLYLGQRDALEEKQSRLSELSELVTRKESMENDIRQISDESGSLEEQLKQTRAGIASKEQEASESLKGLESMIRDESQRFVNITA